MRFSSHCIIITTKMEKKKMEHIIQHVLYGLLDGKQESWWKSGLNFPSSRASEFLCIHSSLLGFFSSDILWHFIFFFGLFRCIASGWWIVFYEIANVIVGLAVIFNSLNEFTLISHCQYLFDANFIHVICSISTILFFPRSLAHSIGLLAGFVFVWCVLSFLLFNIALFRLLFSYFE